MPKKPQKDKTQYENMVGGVIYGGSSDEKRAAFRLMKSESAKKEAELVAIFTQAQQELVLELCKLKAKDLVTYHTEAALARVNKILAQLLGDSEAVASQMIEANILSGKIKALAMSKLTGDELVTAAQLTSVDKARIERMVEQFMGNLKKGANLALASVRSTVQNASIQANMPDPLSDGEDKAETKDEEQSPMSNMFVPDDLQAKKAKKAHAPEKISQKEYEEIIKNPVLFAQKRSKENVEKVQKMHNEYVLGRRENDLLRSAALQAQALKEAKGSSSKMAALRMQQSLIKNGVSAFVDRGGHRWTLANYCAMSARTTSRQSSNFGELFAKEDHDLYLIVPHGSSCPICSKYEGRVYSRSGTNPNYPPLASAFSKIDPNGSDDLDNTYLTIHPNCRHTIVRFIERAQTKEKLEEIRKKSNAPFEVDPRAVEQQKEYAERQKVNAQHNAAKREFLQMLEVLPKNEVKNLPWFEKHFIAKDEVYKALKSRYKELSRANSGDTATPTTT